MRFTWLALALAVIGCSSGADEPAPAEASNACAPIAAAPPIPSPPSRTAPPGEPIAPWSLTASDGPGLELAAIDAKAVVEGPLVFTELHLKLHDPEHRVREGTFAITLPARAAVSRFAMREDGRDREAEVVAKALARRAYDDAIART